MPAVSLASNQTRIPEVDASPMACLLGMYISRVFLKYHLNFPCSTEMVVEGCSRGRAARGQSAALSFQAAVLSGQPFPSRWAW